MMKIFRVFRGISRLNWTQRVCVFFGIFLAILTLFTGISYAQAQGQNLYFSVKQGGNVYPLTPLERAGSVVDFYSYSNDESHTGLEVAEHSILFLYRDTTTGELSLVIIHDIPNNDTGGEVEFAFSGLPSGATILVRDDPQPDTYDFNPPTATIHWNWLPEHNDGVVIGGLGTEFSITIDPNFISGINEWDLVTGSVDNPVYTPLDMSQPITIVATTNIPPRASFVFSPASPSVGQEVQFDASASEDPDGRIVSYEWSFGDGATATGVTVSHAYTSPGSYTVSLTVTDDQGATATATRLVEVAEAVVEATRIISTPAALPGSTFRVIVEIKTSTEIEGLGLDEDLPGGWEVDPVDNAGAAFKRSETQWVWARTIHAGETLKVIYDVTVPQEQVAGPLPVKECITGTIDSASPAFHKPVKGDSCLKIDNCLPPIVALAHLDVQTEEVDLRVANDVSADQVQMATSYWVEDEPVPETCGSLLDLETLKELIAYWLTCTPVDEPLPQADGFADPVTISRRILTPFPFHQLYLDAYRGNIFRVALTITANVDLYGLGVDENLPQGWIVKPIDSSGAIYKETLNQWVFTEKITAGTTKTITYEVTVPTDRVYCLSGEECASNTFNLSGSADSAYPLFTKAVEGDNEVVLAKCLSIPVAIAYLDVETNTIDATLSSTITFEQIQAAIAFWLEDEPVPGTCGKLIDLQMMKLLIAYWLTGTPVNLPLGAEPEDPSG